MKIAQIAPIWYPVPPKEYGGIERVVHYLTEELIQKGHQVTLFASGNSKTKAELISIRKRGLAQDRIPWSDTYWELENLYFAFQRAKDFDIIHCHVGLRALFFQDFVKTPVIHTFHNPIYSKSKPLPPALKILERHQKQTSACFISKSARRLCPAQLRQSWVVYNGIDIELFKFGAKPKNYLLWVGRFDPYKGPENAIRAAEITDSKLYLVGKIDPQRENYFQRRIKPHLSKKIQYWGELSQSQLACLYRGAKAFVYPIEWEEPFGLTMVEAMACGTPVIVFDRGSASELVRDGKTGFVVSPLDSTGSKNISGIASAIKKVEQIKRSDCRRWVEQHFTYQKMVDNYEKAYKEILKRG